MTSVRLSRGICSVRNSEGSGLCCICLPLCEGWQFTVSACNFTGSIRHVCVNLSRKSKVQLWGPVFAGLTRGRLPRQAVNRLFVPSRPQSTPPLPNPRIHPAADPQRPSRRGSMVFELSPEDGKAADPLAGRSFIIRPFPLTGTTKIPARNDRTRAVPPKCAG